MKRFGTRGAVRYGGIVAVLVAVAIVVALAAATAEASPNKPYTANVHQTSGSTTNFTFTLTNAQHASQTLGSANFLPPPGVTLAPGPATSVSLNGWTATVDSSGILEIRSPGAPGLAGGQSVSATVDFTRTAACTATAGSATWGVQAKQSNDFSGSPGNFMQLDAAGSDLTPLGSFVMAPIQTSVTAADGSQFPVPQIKTGVAAPISITAYDTCGNVDQDYSGATLNTEQGFGLVNAAFSPISWSSGIGTATLTPVDVEVGDQFTVNDGPSGISQASSSTSPSQTFDVTQTICAKQGTVCVWTDSKKPITATSTVPGDNNGHASLGLGYKPFGNGVTCGGRSPIGDSIYIDPYQYTQPYTIVITYAKSLVPKGPASNVITCKGTDNPDGTTTWSPTAIPPCPNTPVAPCAQSANVQGGALQVTLYLDPGDPHSGGFG